MNDTPRVAVVVVTYSPGQALDVFLDSLTAIGTEVQVVLADNGSDDGSVQRAARRPNVRLLETGGNLGYGRAANAGVAVTDADLVVIANPDIAWHPEALDLLVDAAIRHPEAVAFGPRIVTPAGRTYPSARDLPQLSTGIGHAVFGWWWPSNPWTARYRRERDELTERPAGWLSGSCLLVRRTAFDTVNGFDPTFFMYFEDVDLGERLGKIGINLYVPEAVVVHEGGHATRRDPRRMARAHHDSAWIYLQRRYPARRHAALRVALHAGLYLRAVLARRSRVVAAGARLATHTQAPEPER